MLHGPLPEQWANVADAPHLWRKTPFILLLASLLVFGCFPRLLTDKIQPSVREKVVVATLTDGSNGSSRREQALKRPGPEDMSLLMSAATQKRSLKGC